MNSVRCIIALSIPAILIITGANAQGQIIANQRTDSGRFSFNSTIETQWLIESLDGVFNASLERPVELQGINLLGSLQTVEQLKRDLESIPTTPSPGSANRVRENQAEEAVIVDPNVVQVSGTYVQSEDQQKSPDSVQTPVVPVADETSISSLLAEIERQKQLLKNEDQTDEALKNNRLELLSNAHNSLLKAQTYRAKKEDYEKQLAEYPELIEQLKEIMSEPPLDESLDVTDKTTSEGLQPQLQRLQRELATMKKASTDLQGENDALGLRITEIPGIRATTMKQLNAVKANLLTISDSTEDLDAHLGWLIQNTRKISLESQLEMLDAERRRQELAGEALPLKRDQFSRDIKRLEAQVAEHERAIGELRRKELREQGEQARIEASKAHPALKDIASRNEELTRLRKNITARIEKATVDLAEVDEKVESLVATQADLDNKIQRAGGVTDSNGMLLIESRRSLNSSFENNVQIQELKSELRTLNIALIALEEERETLSDPAEFVESQLKEMADEVVHGHPLSEMGIKFVETKREYLDDLIKDYNHYRGLLTELEVSRNKLIAQVFELRKYIDEKALWVRNAEPVSLDDIKSSTTAMKAFFAAEGWAGVWDQMFNRVLAKPHETALGVTGVFALLVFTRRLKKLAS